MEKVQLLRGDGLALVFDVDDLSPQHPPGADGPGKLGGGLHHPLGGIFPGEILAQHRLEAQGLQAVPGQHRHGLPVLHMAGGLAPAQVVVVHAGQIVVDEGVGVYQLQGAAEGEGPPPVAAGQIAEG